jgi:hypothetical protein
LIVWDHLFGTYQQEIIKPTFGLVKPIDSVNPINVHFHEAKNLVIDLRAAQSLGEIIHHLFSRPGALWISKQLDERRAT